MRASQFWMRVPKSETRDLADQETDLRRAETFAWRMSTSTFFIAFVAIAALLAIVALFVI